MAPFGPFKGLYGKTSQKHSPVCDFFTPLFGVKPNIGEVDIGRGEFSARPLVAASPAVLQMRSGVFLTLITSLNAPGPPKSLGDVTRSFLRPLFHNEAVMQ